MDQELQSALQEQTQVVPPPPPLPKKNNLLLWFLFVVLLFGSGWGLYLTAREQGWLPSGFSPTPTPVAIEEPTPTPDPTANWKTYTKSDVGVSFKYPSEWEEQPLLVRGSGFTQDIADKKNVYRLTFMTVGNYSQNTGKPYETIQEFALFPYPGNIIMVDGAEGHQYLPRAGGENINDVTFFSRDLKSIYSITLQTGDSTISDPKVTLESVEEGKRIFDQILSTFKFLDEMTTKKSCQYNGVEYKDGENFDAMDGCNKCFCSDGNVGCTLIACQE